MKLRHLLLLLVLAGAVWGARRVYVMRQEKIDLEERIAALEAEREAEREAREAQRGSGEIRPGGSPASSVFPSDATRNVECPACRGSGREMFGSVQRLCRICGGAGHRTMPTGRALCTTCRGMGRVRADGRARRCLPCQGSGFAPPGARSR